MSPTDTPGWPVWLPHTHRLQGAAPRLPLSTEGAFPLSLLGQALNKWLCSPALAFVFPVGVMVLPGGGLRLLLLSLDSACRQGAPKALTPTPAHGAGLVALHRVLAC